MKQSAIEKPVGGALKRSKEEREKRFNTLAILQKMMRENEKFYYKIDECIEEIVSSRLKKYESLEGFAMCKAENLTVGALQNLSWLNGRIKSLVGSEEEGSDLND